MLSNNSDSTPAPKETKIDNETQRKLAMLSQQESFRLSKEGKISLALEYNLIAIQTLKNIASELFTDQDHNRLAKFYLISGQYYRLLKDYDEAKICFIASLNSYGNLTEADCDIQSIASAKINLADLYAQDQNPNPISNDIYKLYSEAEALLKKSKDEDKNDDDFRLLAACYCGLAQHQPIQSDKDKKLSHYTHAHIYLQKIRNPTEEDHRNEASYFNQTANMYLQSEHFVVAYFYFEQGLLALKKISLTAKIQSDQELEKQFESTLNKLAEYKPASVQQNSTATQTTNTPKVTTHNDQLELKILRDNQQKLKEDSEKMKTKLDTLNDHIIELEKKTHELEKELDLSRKEEEKKQERIQAFSTSTSSTGTVFFNNNSR